MRVYFAEIRVFVVWQISPAIRSTWCFGRNVLCVGIGVGISCVGSGAGIGGSISEHDCSALEK